MAASLDSVGAVIDAYLSYKLLEFQGGCLSAGAWDKAQRYCRSFAADFGQRLVSQCGQSDLTKWVMSHPGWQSPHTRDDAVGAVVTAFRWQEDEDTQFRSPFRRPRRRPWGRPQPRAAITPGEYSRIMQMARKCNGRGKRARPSRTAFRVMLWFLWEVGARTCEGRELRWEQIDWERGLAVLKSKSTKETGEPRVIVLRRGVLFLLRLIYRRRWYAQKFQPEPGDRVFLNGRKRPWNRTTYSKQFRKYARMAGVREEVSSYSARHAYCVRGIEAGLADRELADLLGQKSVRYISWYGRTTRTKADHLRRTAERLDPRRNGQG